MKEFSVSFFLGYGKVAEIVRLKQKLFRQAAVPMVPEWIKILVRQSCVTFGGVAAFHQPKFKSSSRERLRAGGDSGVPSEDDDDDDDPCISRSSPECHGTECDHGAEGGHDHFHLRGGSSSSGDFRSKSSLRNDRYKCFGLLESNILNSFQLQNFRRKNGSEYDSANSTGVFGSSKKFNSMSLEATTNRLKADTRKVCHLRRGGRLGTNRMPEENSDSGQKLQGSKISWKIAGKKQETSQNK
ncbi:conserved hypothetical protein [Culex quinquefasciatus]|uniref:Uncharacterized protein n=1 Tax=Culex quinquefasciatus TaxID=7176 RepID=B0XF67_CULQU|nr:conserved hypothetical protein [Culex quinquefasciatus]|eukprot:XP_001868289.1 conserved hypothetical protein [Culex quinquefasciatus]